MPELGEIHPILDPIQYLLLKIVPSRMLVGPGRRVKRDGEVEKERGGEEREKERGE